VLDNLPLLAARDDLYSRAGPTPEWFDYTKANGIDPKTCYPFCGLLAVTACVFFSGRFQFAGVNEDDAETSAVIECLGEDAETILDLCAWPFSDPARFATMFCTALALGIDRIANPASYFLGRHLQLHRTPLRWLQADCDGAVILDHATAHLWLNRALGPVAGEDREHAEAIRRAAVPPHLPASQILAPLGAPHEGRSARIRATRRPPPPQTVRRRRRA
jgi:hypothetical protein